MAYISEYLGYSRIMYCDSDILLLNLWETYGLPNNQIYIWDLKLLSRVQLNLLKKTM